MKGSYAIGRVWGIPIKLHITLLIALPLFALHLSAAVPSFSLFWGFMGVVGLFASVALHELGHSFVALAKGCGVREIMLLPIGGVARLDRMPRRPADEIGIALAGPAVSLLLAVLLIPLGAILTALGLQAAGVAASFLAMVNGALLLFNLVPSFPMDGGRVFRALLTPRLGRVAATRIAARIGRALAIVFGIAGLLTFNLVWMLIAAFIYSAAGAEYRAVRLEEAFTRVAEPPRRSFGEAAAWPDEVVVGPPPYRRGPGGRVWVRMVRNQQDVFSHLFDRWSVR